MKQDELNINECLCDFEKTVINYNNQNFKKAFRGFNYFVNLKTNHTKLKKISVSSEIYLMRMYALGQFVKQNRFKAAAFSKKISSYKLSEFNDIFLNLQIADLKYTRGKKINNTCLLIDAYNLVDECFKSLDKVNEYKMRGGGFYSYRNISIRATLLKAKIYSMKTVCDDYNVKDEIRRWSFIIDTSRDYFILSEAIYYLMKVVIDNFVSEGVERYSFDYLYELSLKVRKCINDDHPLIEKYKYLKYVMDDLKSLTFTFSLSK